MSNLIIFNSLLVASAVFAFARGGPPERFAAGAMLLAAVLSRAAYIATTLDVRFRTLEQAVFVVDLALLFGLVALALRANRYWTMPLAALQLSSVAVHLAKVIDPFMFGWSYAFLLKVWAYPMVVLPAVGAARHRSRLIAIGADQSWS